MNPLKCKIELIFYKKKRSFTTKLLLDSLYQKTNIYIYIIFKQNIARFTQNLKLYFNPD